MKALWYGNAVLWGGVSLDVTANTHPEEIDGLPGFARSSLKPNTFDGLCSYAFRAAFSWEVQMGMNLGFISFFSALNAAFSESIQ